MVERIYEIRWNKSARTQLKAIYDYVQKDSLQSAIKIINTIIDTTETLNRNPERFGIDKLKKANDGSYRYVEIYRYRVAFRIYHSHIRILRIRSTDQEPLGY